MAIPNDIGIAQRLEAQGFFGRVATGDTRAASLFARLFAFTANPTADPAGWGWLKKGGGHNVDGYAEDAVVFGNGALTDFNVADLVVGAGAAGAHLPTRLNPKERRIGVDTWEAPRALTAAQMDYLKPGAVPSHSTLLGCSLFWGMAGLRSHPAKLRRNLAWIRDELGADYVRVFAVVGGDLFSGADPWRDAGSFVAWADWQALMGQFTDLCFDEYGFKVEWTLFGSRGQTPAMSDCERVVDRFLTQAAPRPGKLALVEVWNEYNVNGASAVDLRRLARRLRAGLPATVPIALSSPGTVHACASAADIHAEVARMHDGLPEANAITPHWCRANHVAPSLGTAPRLVYSNEPRGPGASAGGDVDDPAKLASDYRAAIAADYAGYIYHPLGGIWGGLCHPNWPQENRWPDVFSSPGANATAAQLKAIRQGGAVPPIDPGEPEMPLPDRAEMMDEGQKLDVYYAAPEGLKRPQGLSINDAPDWEGVGAWLFDVYLKARVAGKSREDARAAYVRDIRHSDEWRSKHPGETP